MIAVDTGVYEHYNLYISADKFFLEPVESADQSCLLIDRISREFSLQNSKIIPINTERTKVFGLIGVINLVAGPYLLVITKATQIGQIQGHYIWEVKDIDTIPFSRTTLHLTEAQVRENRQYYEMIQGVLRTQGFYFSYTFDLTHSLQRLNNTTPDFPSMPMHERADPRFVWNRHALSPLILQPELHRYALPLMHGFVGIRQCRLGDKEFQLALVSRRSWYRAGTRFNVRGVDEHGHTANFIETEQIVLYANYLCSYIQTRGSIPLFWSQKPNLKWQPQPLLMENEKQISGFVAHMTDQQLQYPGTHVIVNLLNSKGREKKLGEKLEEIVGSSGLEHVKYVYFDFHKECKNMNWARIGLLIDQLKPDIEKFRFFAFRVDGIAGDGVHQSGYMRTNCMDCLDRTNVVQSMLAKESLTHQLQWLNITSPDDAVQGARFDAIFKNLWADNGDYCSFQYAGTGALKADFTRLGKRTYGGGLNDLRNALHRYVKNNFTDGDRQDAIDLFLGNHIVDIDRFKPICSRGIENWQDWRGFVILFTTIALFMAILTFLVSTEHTAAFMGFWIFLLVILLSIIFYNGEEFVNTPKLKID